MNKDFQSNTFQGGMSLDPSDMILPNNVMRFGQNVRVVNRQSTSFVATNIQGSEQSFSLYPGFIPVAIQEYAGVLYIISWYPDEGQLEIGSYPSPDYENYLNDPGTEHNAVYQYSAFRNITDQDLQEFWVEGDVFGTYEKPIIQKLEIQPEYDLSVNLCFTIKGQKPRIVNSKFISAENGTKMTVVATRGSGITNSNEYTLASVAKETLLVLASTKIIKINFTGIESAGGKLKPGNYQYVFYYMTEDFSRTSVVGQSSICQVFFGETMNSVRGGDETEETNKQIKLTLSNLDTDFKYLKVYVIYSSGQETISQQYLEFVQPIEITSENSFLFTHNGYEELRETSIDEVNVDYAPIDSASACTQVGGYLFLGDIKQRDVTFDGLKDAVKNLVVPILQSHSLPISAISSLDSSIKGYANPANTYNYLGYMRGETYAFAIVFIMKDGSLSPAFPMKSNFQGTIIDDGKGLVTFKYHYQDYLSSSENFFTNTNIIAKYVEIDVTNLINNYYVYTQTIGFFVVRSERRRNVLTQGILIPTVKAPTIEADNGSSSNPFGTDPNSASNAGGYYFDNGADANVNDTNIYKHLINLDGILEGYFNNRYQSSNDTVVIDELGAIKDGFIPVVLRSNEGTTNYNNTSKTVPKRIWFSKTGDSYARHWAFLSGEALVNEPEFVTSLERENVGVLQISKPSFRVDGNIGKVSSLFSTGVFGSHYEMTSNPTIYPYSFGNALKSVDSCSYVPADSLTTGNEFISKIKAALVTRIFTDNSSHVLVNQKYDSYFGLKFSTNGGQLQDSTVSSTNPIGGNSRSGKNDINDGGAVDARFQYDNYGKSVPAAFLVNLYSQGVPATPANLYPSIDNLVYKQVTQRYSWDEFTGSNVIPVFGGDCFISKISRKLNRGPESSNIYISEDAYLRSNIDSGLVISWWQESKYNLHLRQPKTFDSVELEERSFFPFRNLGSITEYRKYRLPETKEHSPGYAYTQTLKSFYSLSQTAPFEQTRFMSRIYHSEKHIPNAFRNGYRSFLSTNYRDYATQMGRVVGMFNLRGNLLVVFEHGIGITAIEQRVETGKDSAGAVFIEPTSVLPPTLTYLSKEIGCQDHFALVQTPGAVYGVDKSKDKIWMISRSMPTGGSPYMLPQDTLSVISDQLMVASWIIDNPIVNPRSGYDLENNEVIFATDNWTMCYSENVQKFTSFYTMNNVTLFARRNKELYSFLGSQSYIHNVPNNYLLYEDDTDVVIEFVVNKGLAATKILDYLNIVSNEVPPSKIEVYTYNQDVGLEVSINPSSSAINQYSVILNEFDTIRDAENFIYMDKGYVTRINNRSFYHAGTAEDTWVADYFNGEVDGRIREKHIIIRITYTFTDSNNKPLELGTVLSYFRYSKS